MDLASKQDCIDAQQPPHLNRGDTLDSSCFYRNLRKEDVAPVYIKEPDYGDRLKTSKVKKWSDVEGQRGFSVNWVECIRSPQCSILVSPNADQFCHVWEIDLEVLNKHLASLNDPFQAQYKPREDNKCHFELVSTEGQVNPTQIPRLLDELLRGFPPKDKDPPVRKRPPEGQEQEAEEASAKYHDLVRIHHDPLGRLDTGS